MTDISISKASRNLSHWINKATYGNECVVLTSHGKPKAVLVGVDAFETLLGIDSNIELVSLDALQTQFKSALNKSGYATREDIIELVQDVKKEMVSNST